MKLFEFINKDSNDLLSNFSYSDLNELLSLLKDYKISYRSSLNIPSFITFGTEIEVCSKNEKEKEKLDEILKKLNDTSLSNPNWYFDSENIPFCTEFTSPILTDTYETWRDLSIICDTLKNNNAIITNDTGGHIHFGLHILGKDKNAWMNFIRLWSVYENIIFRFSYGEYERERECIEFCSKPLSYKLYNDYYELLNCLEGFNLRDVLFILIPKIYKSNCIGTYYSKDISDEATKNSTIEFRVPNSSTEEVIWQNNINFFYHLLNTAKNGFDDDIVNERIKSIIQNDLALYREVIIEQAIEFADLIFDNNLDKINFLRQYIKDNSTSNDFIKCKSFIQKHS